MRISALEEYGLRCLLRVAEREGDDDPVSAQTIADMEGLSLPNTQKIMRILSRGGLIESRRGTQGGYVLGKALEEITVGDAMRVLGGMLEIEDICGKHTGELNECSNACGCAIRPVWQHLSDFVIFTLESIPLGVLLEDEQTVIAHLNGTRQAHREHHSSQLREVAQ